MESVIKHKDFPLEYQKTMSADRIEQNRVIRRKVKFYWWNKCEVWFVSGADLEEITKKAYEKCRKYKAKDFKIMEEN